MTLSQTPTETPPGPAAGDDLEAMLERGDDQQIRQLLSRLDGRDLPRALSRLAEEGQLGALTLLDPEEAADLMASLSDVQAADILEDLPASAAAAILHELPSNDQADLIQEIAEAEAGAILDALEPTEADSVRELAAYSGNQAGGLMETEILAYGRRQTVASVSRDLADNGETYRDYSIQYLYVVDEGRRLVGTLRFQDLLMSSPATTLESLMTPDPLVTADGSDLDELEELLDDRHLLALPVVDDGGRLLGVVRRAHVLEALAERAESDYLKSQGVVGGEELRSMPVLQRARRRLSWLSINILLNMLAASVIAFYQDTLAAVISLAVFLPILSDMSGCSGNQAAAVSMRELSLGLARPRDLARTWWKEVSVGLINGLVLGLLLAGAAFLWRGSLALGLVVGGALAINTLVAVSIGGLIPLLLSRFGFDPALASGPVLTTVTDLSGFLLALGFATAMLQHLV